MDIDILHYDKKIKKYGHLQEIPALKQDFLLMQITNYTSKDIQEIETTFHIDASIIKQFEDIEISSHFLLNPTQIALHISLPFYNEAKELLERPIFFILTKKCLFLFLNSDIEEFIFNNYLQKSIEKKEIKSIEDIFDLQIELISDYYADITESEIKKVKQLAIKVLEKEKFTNNTLNLIAKHSYNNLLIKEMLIETLRVFNLYKKNSGQTHIDIQKEIDREISDLSVVSDYIQFNSERLQTLKESVARKIDVEQNYIFKVLTIITLCISLPTMIAGIYGMNFEYMPELSKPYAYPIVLVAMLISVFIPIIIFKKKRWL